MSLQYVQDGRWDGRSMFLSSAKADKGPWCGFVGTAQETTAVEGKGIAGFDNGNFFGLVYLRAVCHVSGLSGGRRRQNGE